MNRYLDKKRTTVLAPCPQCGEETTTHERFCYNGLCGKCFNKEGNKNE